MINVSKPFLPPADEYKQYLDGIWQRNWLTNNGPLVNELELQLKKYLGVKHLLFAGNGTIALQMAIKALALKGEIITTPFSYVATTSSIVWEGCTPVFADVDAATCNIDPVKIEAAITPNTSAILATHVYGNPCDVDAIDAIAKKYKLKVIYDAAHCFGTLYKGKSIFEYGDIVTTSFHATKIFHTVEGGAVFTKKAELLKAMAYLRNFGHDGPEKFSSAGINGKNSEFHAAMGLVNLKYIGQILEKYKVLAGHYDDKMKRVQACKPVCIEQGATNHAYYPLLFQTEELLTKCVEALNRNNVFPRRYFYPALSSVLPYVQHVQMPVADDLSKRALCLPLYYDLSTEEIDFICRIILRVQNFG
jgi:dTDP-4-amino-4,6-dideoxygalactose transaminase